MSHSHSVRQFNVVMGAWMFVSTLVWPHTPQQFTNACLVGAVASAVALLAMRLPGLHYLNVATAAWLFTSAWVLPIITRTSLWNNVFIAIMMFIAALLPDPLLPSEPSYSRPGSVRRAA